MARAVIAAVILYKMCSVQSAGNSESLYLSIKPGEAATLRCPYEEHSSTSMRMWFKQGLEHSPLEVASKLGTKDAIFSSQFNQSRFKANRNASSFSLTIENVSKQDEGMYFCGVGDEKTLKISNSTFLAVTGDIKISVDQTPVFQKIIIGNGTTECLTESYVPLLSLGVFSGVCVVVICVQAIVICKMRKSGEKLQEGEGPPNQDHNADNLNYAPIRFIDKKTGRERKKEQPEELVYSQVRISHANDHRSKR